MVESTEDIWTSGLYTETWIHTEVAPPHDGETVQPRTITKETRLDSCWRVCEGVEKCVVVYVQADIDEKLKTQKNLCYFTQAAIELMMSLGRMHSSSPRPIPWVKKCVLFALWDEEKDSGDSLCLHLHWKVG